MRSVVRRRHAAVLAACLTAILLPGGTPAHGIANGDPVAADTYGFLAHLRIGDVRACSGALVDIRSLPEQPGALRVAVSGEQWVLTAASCFAQDGRPTRSGPPPWPTTVTIGRTDLLAADDGLAVQATDVISHPDRDVALVRLADQVIGVRPAELVADPLPAGSGVRVAGYGRTESEWVSDRLDSGAFTVQSVDDQSYGLTGTGTPLVSACQGDAGAPMFRGEPGAASILYGLVSTSWQAGCLTETETRNGATAAGLHGLGGWIGANTAYQPGGLVRLEQGELTGDLFTDVLGMDSRGNLWLYPGLATPARFGPRLLVGSGWTDMVHMTVGEFTGDDLADVVGGDRDGKLWVYPGRGTAGFGSRIQIGSRGWTSMVGLDTGRFNADAYDDLLAIGTDGQLWVYPGRSDGRLNSRVQIGSGGWAAMVHVAAGEFNEDVYTDVLAIDSAGRLWLYPGLGTAGLGSRIRIGNSGWATMRTLTVGEFNRDAYNDVLVFDKGGKLWLYPGTEAPGLAPRMEIR